MSKKRVAVLFEEDRIPRIFKSPSDDDIKEMRKLGKVLVNPRIPKKVSPEKWILVGNNIQVGAPKSMLSSKTQIIKEIEVINQPSFSDLEELEDYIEYIKLELIDKQNKTCIMGLLMALFLLTISFRTEIQQLIMGIK